MAQLKSISKKLVLIIVTISLLLTFIITPSVEAKLTLEDGEFYYAGTTKGTYKASTSIFAWLLDNIGQIADWLLGIMTMGIRMVFVGWTALIEKILTWTLEGTTGIQTDGEDVSSTDLSSVSDSSNNITVQAIVYNQVPMFDANFFNIDYDKTYSGTGVKLRCSKCEKPVDECCKADGSGCECEKCKGNCDGCQRYIAALNVEGDPIIVQIKKVVANWYHVIRLLAIAALLIVLLGVGIKMGLSTIASEKAVYKRMIIDWVVGVIIVFAIHYIMVFVVYMNSALVNTVKESAKSINKVQMMQLAEKSTDNIEYTDEDLEIKIYEAVRSRAYDPKLMNGTTGMLMYMTLVYFAIRYSIVYLKRLLTLIVLTLMGPAVGVSYAMQKVFSGKSQSLTNWGTEYTMNVIIQTVHAIIYSVFISTALILSLQSVAGMILALILMNYALKAEKTFRTIFKMGAGGSLLDHTAGAGDAEKMKEGFETARGLAMGAKPVGKALMNTPYAKALKGGLKLGVAAGLQTANLFRGNGGGSASEGGDGGPDVPPGGTATAAQQSSTPRADALLGTVADNTPTVDGGEGATAPEVKGAPAKTLINAGEAKLVDEVNKAAAALNAEKVGGKQPSAATKQRFDQSMANLQKYRQLGANISTGDIIKGHAERLIDIENHYSIQYNDSGKMTFGSYMNTIFGTESRDYKTGKYVSDRNGFFNDLAADRLLGFTPEDKKKFKEEVWKPIRNGFGGITAAFLGMGTLVAHPQLGMAMVAGGYAATRSALKKPISAGDYKGTYSFSRFSSPTMAKIQKETRKRAKREWNQMVKDNVKNNHPELYKQLRNSNSMPRIKAENFKTDLTNGLKLTGTLAGIGLVGGVLPAVAPLAFVGAASLPARKLMSKTAFGTRMDGINKHSAKQLHQQQLQFAEEGYKMQAQVKAVEFQSRIESFEQRVEKDALTEAGFVYNQQTKSWDVLEEHVSKNYNSQLQDIYAKKGITYDLAAGQITRKDAAGNEITESVELRRDEFSIVNKNNKKTRIPISDNDFKKVRTAVETTIEKVLSDNPELDMQDQATQEKVNQILSEKLVSAGVIARGQTAETLFKGGKEAMAETLGRQVDFKKAKMEAASTALDGMDTKTRRAIEGSIEKIREKGSSATNISVGEIIKTLNGDGSTSADSSKDGSVQLSQQDMKRVQLYVDNLTAGTKITAAKMTESEVLKRRRQAASRKKSALEFLSADIDKEGFAELVEAAKNGEGMSIERSRILSPEERAERRKKIAALEKEGKIYSKSDNPVKEGTIEIDAKDTRDVLELLLMRKELKDLNKEAAEELKLKKGPDDFNKATKEESKAKVRKYKADLELKKHIYEREQQNIFTEDEKNKALFDRERELEQRLADATILLDLAVEEKTIHGPVVNVDDFLTDIVRSAGSTDTAKYMREVISRDNARLRQNIQNKSEMAARRQRRQAEMQQSEADAATRKKEVPKPVEPRKTTKQTTKPKK